MADLGGPPHLPKIFLISWSFSENLTKSYVGAPLEGRRPLLQGILDPPLVSALPPPDIAVSLMTNYRPQTKLQKGNVFTSVCQEYCPQSARHPPPGRHPLGRQPLKADTPTPFQAESGRYTSYWKACLLLIPLPYRPKSERESEKDQRIKGKHLRKFSRLLGLSTT